MNDPYTAMQKYQHFIQQGEYQQAKALLQEILKTPNLPIAIRILLERLAGDCEFYQGKNKEALEIYEQSLRKAIEIDEPSEIINNFKDKGKVYLREGRYEEALDNFQKALKKAREVDNPLSIISNLQGEGEVYLREGRYEKALDSFQESLKKAKEISFPGGILINFGSIGDTHLKAGRKEEALKNFQQALDGAKKIDNPLVIINMLESIGEEHAKERRYEKAFSSFQEALEKAKETNNPLGIISNLGNLGDLHLQRNNPNKALENFKQALKKAQEISSSLGILTNALQILRVNTVSLHEKLGYCEKCLESIQAHRPHITNRVSRLRFDQQRFKVYEIGVELAFVLADQATTEKDRQKYHHLALEWSEESRNKEMRFVLAQNRMREGNGSDTKNWHDYHLRFAHEAEKVFPDISHLSSPNKAKRGLPASFIRGRGTKNSYAHQYQPKPLPASSPSASASKPEQNSYTELEKEAKLNEMVASLADEAVVLQFICQESKIIVTAYGKGKNQEPEFFLPAQKLESSPQELRHQLEKLSSALEKSSQTLEQGYHNDFQQQKEEEYPPLLAGLYDNLEIDRVLEAIQEKRELATTSLIIQPDKFLYAVPFHALLDGEEEEYLYQKFADMHLAVSLHSSKSSSVSEKHSAAFQQVRCCFFGCAGKEFTYDQEGKITNVDNPLPYVRQEALGVQKVVGKDNFLGFGYARSLLQASKQNFSQNHSLGNIVIVSAHGKFQFHSEKVERKPESAIDSSFELLADAPEQEQTIPAIPLSLTELLKSDDNSWDFSPTEIVILSCCSLGRHETIAHEMMGIIAALYARKCRSLLSALWELNDEVTSEFIPKFIEKYLIYRQQEEVSYPRARAWKETLDWLRQNESYDHHPYFFAPFFVIGRG